MGKLIDETGNTYSRLTVVARADNKGTRAKWLCECECGNTTEVTGKMLRTGKTKSCGCYRAEVTAPAQGKSNAKHGQSRTREYQNYHSMIRRCYNIIDKDFKNYGARGVIVCDRWLDSYEDYYADMGDRPIGMTLDRINYSGDYSPDNCRWADMETQNNNRRDNRLVTVDGITDTFANTAKRKGVNYSTAMGRFHRDQSLDQVFRRNKCTHK